MPPRRSLRKSTELPSRQKPTTSETPRSSTRKSANHVPAKSTPTKSGYFKKKPDKVEDEPASDESESSATNEEEDSGYEENPSSVAPDSESENDDGDDPSSEEDAKAKKRKRPQKSTPKKSQPAGKRAKGQELWREGVTTGLEPGVQVIIPKPKAREAGKTPYKKDTIHPNTLLFLQDLKKNNDREWLKMHDPDYRASLKDFNEFVECLTEKITEADETVPELPIKDIVFRIYRDVRFSKDPTPYKTHFSAAWSRTGRKGPYAAYYFQVSPGSCFVGGGLWMPDPIPLSALRRDIDRKPYKIRSVLRDGRLRREVLGVSSDDEKKVLKAFANSNSGNALKTKPKGFEADHRDIELLRLRNFTIGKKLKDQDVLGPKGLEHVSQLMSAMVPFITYLNSVVMPDDPDASSSSSEDEEGAEGDVTDSQADEDVE